MGGIASAGSPSKQFKSYPQPVDQQVLATCFDRFRQITLHENAFSCLTDHENDVIVSFFQFLEKETLSQFDFPVGVGARMYIPNENARDDELRNKIMKELKETHQIKTESYI